jgi:hypothetical protein
MSEAAGGRTQIGDTSEAVPERPGSQGQGRER